MSQSDSTNDKLTEAGQDVKQKLTALNDAMRSKGNEKEIKAINYSFEAPFSVITSELGGLEGKSAALELFRDPEMGTPGPGMSALDECVLYVCSIFNSIVARVKEAAVPITQKPAFRGAFLHMVNFLDALLPKALAGPRASLSESELKAIHGMAVETSQNLVESLLEVLQNRVCSADMEWCKDVIVRQIVIQLQHMSSKEHIEARGFLRRFYAWLSAETEKVFPQQEQQQRQSPGVRAQKTVRTHRSDRVPARASDEKRETIVWAHQALLRLLEEHVSLLWGDPDVKQLLEKGEAPLIGELFSSITVVGPDLKDLAIHMLAEIWLFFLDQKVDKKLLEKFTSFITEKGCLTTYSLWKTLAEAGEGAELVKDQGDSLGATKAIVLLYLIILAKGNFLEEGEGYWSMIRREWTSSMRKNIRCHSGKIIEFLLSRSTVFQDMPYMLYSSLTLALSFLAFMTVFTEPGAEPAELSKSDEIAEIIRRLVPVAQRISASSNGALFRLMTARLYHLEFFIPIAGNEGFDLPSQEIEHGERLRLTFELIHDATRGPLKDPFGGQWSLPFELRFVHEQLRITIADDKPGELARRIKNSTLLQLRNCSWELAILMEGFFCPDVKVETDLGSKEKLIHELSQALLRSYRVHARSKIHLILTTSHNQDDHTFLREAVKSWVESVPGFGANNDSVFSLQKLLILYDDHILKVFQEIPEHKSSQTTPWAPLAGARQGVPVLPEQMPSNLNPSEGHAKRELMPAAAMAATDLSASQPWGDSTRAWTQSESQANVSKLLQQIPNVDRTGQPMEEAKPGSPDRAVEQPPVTSGSLQVGKVEAGWGSHPFLRATRPRPINNREFVEYRGNRNFHLNF